jgi:PAS domain-containing protein
LAAAVREHDLHFGGLIRSNLRRLRTSTGTTAAMCNVAFETLFGYRESDILGQDIEPLIVPPEKADEASA